MQGRSVILTTLVGMVPGPALVAQAPSVRSVYEELKAGKDRRWRDVAYLLKHGYKVTADDVRSIFDPELGKKGNRMEGLVCGLMGWAHTHTWDRSTPVRNLALQEYLGWFAHGSKVDYYVAQIRAARQRSAREAREALKPCATRTSYSGWQGFHGYVLIPRSEWALLADFELRAVIARAQAVDLALEVLAEGLLGSRSREENFHDIVLARCVAPLLRDLHLPAILRVVQRDIRVGFVLLSALERPDLPAIATGEIARLARYHDEQWVKAGVSEEPRQAAIQEFKHEAIAALCEWLRWHRNRFAGAVADALVERFPAESTSWLDAPVRVHDAVAALGGSRVFARMTGELADIRKRCPWLDRPEAYKELAPRVETGILRRGSAAYFGSLGRAVTPADLPAHTRYREEARRGGPEASIRAFLWEVALSNVSQPETLRALRPWLREMILSNEDEPWIRRCVPLHDDTDQRKSLMAKAFSKVGLFPDLFELAIKELDNPRKSKAGLLAIYDTAQLETMEYLREHPYEHTSLPAEYDPERLTRWAIDALERQPPHPAWSYLSSLLNDMYYRGHLEAGNFLIRCLTDPHLEPYRDRVRKDFAQRGIRDPITWWHAERPLFAAMRHQREGCPCLYARMQKMEAESLRLAGK